MGEQERKAKRATEPEPSDGAKANPRLAATGKAIKKSLDEVLDEIDDVLEENAEEFVKSYVQRGGE